MSKIKLHLFLYMYSYSSQDKAGNSKYGDCEYSRTYLLATFIVYVMHVLQGGYHTIRSVAELLIQLLSGFFLCDAYYYGSFLYCLVLHLLHVCTMYAVLLGLTRTALSFV